MNKYQTMVEDFLMSRRQIRGTNDRLITESEIRNLILKLGDGELTQEESLDSYLSMLLRSLRRHTNLYNLLHEMGKYHIYSISIYNNYKEHLEKNQKKGRTTTQIKASYLDRLRKQIDRANTNIGGAHLKLDILKQEGDRLIDMETTLLVLKLHKDIDKV